MEFCLQKRVLYLILFLCFFTFLPRINTIYGKSFVFQGTIETEEKVTLRFPMSGKLEWVGVKEGDIVKRNQIIATLDKREIQKKLDKYLKTYLKTRWDFEQTRDDYQNKVVTTEIKRIFDQSQFDLDSSVLDVEIQNLSLELATLYSPIPGVVTEIGSPFSGVNIIPSQAEFEIVNPAKLFFSIMVD